MIDYLHGRQTITGDYYTTLIKKKKTNKPEKQSKRRGRGLCLPVHRSAVAMTTINEASYEIMHHPFHLPDLTPSDFYLFPNLKNSL